MASDLKVLWEVPRLNASDYDYGLFWKEYMRPNKPVLVTGLMDSWRACKDWVLESGAPNLSFIAENFGASRVLVADCGRKEFTDQKRQEMTVLEFVKYWQELKQEPKGSHPTASASSPDLLLYLKDWHFVKDFPGYCAYKTPEAFADDWLNTYLDAFQMHSVNAELTPKRSDDDNQCSDYRFVYMGPKGTWTPLHADVFRSYSWSGNVCGRKRWLLLPPDQMDLVYDRFHRDTVFDIYSEVSAQQFRGFSQTRWMECNQGPGEILFVPSGWFHQVTNVEDTISINHNWLNACNLHWVWELLKKEYMETVKSIEDIRSISDDFELLCQRNLAANSGMNYLDLAIFLAKMTDSSIKLLSDMNREFLGRRDRVLMIDGPNDSLEWEGCVWENATRQCLFNLLQIKQIVEELTYQDVFQLLGDSFPASVNCKYLDAVDKLRVESDDNLIAAAGNCSSQHDRSPEICFIAEFLSEFWVAEKTVSAGLLEQTEDGHEGGGSNSGAEGVESFRKLADATGTSVPSFIVKTIQYIIDLATEVGIKTSDLEDFSITLPVTLTVDPY